VFYHVSSAVSDVTSDSRNIKHESLTKEKSRHESCVELQHSETNRDGAYLISWSSCAPVDTGFRYHTLAPLSFLSAALQRSVENIVFPTSVFAPKTWYARKLRHREDPTGGMLLLHDFYGNISMMFCILCMSTV